MKGWFNIHKVINMIDINKMKDKNQIITVLAFSLCPAKAGGHDLLLCSLASLSKPADPHSLCTLQVPFQRWKVHMVPMFSPCPPKTGGCMCFMSSSEALIKPVSMTYP